MSYGTDRSTVLDEQMLRVFGADNDPMEDVEARARQVFPHKSLIVWEGNPETFAFTYVGGDAEALLGYPARQWVEDAAFWAEYVIHPSDKDEAIAYCALATGRRKDHVFEYRARTRGYDVVWLRDYVRVVLGSRRLPVRLRGLMVDVTAEKRLKEEFEQKATYQLPTFAALQAA